VLGAGTVGVKEGRKLQVLNADGPISAANMGEEKRRKYGIAKRMPLSWEESMKAFGSDELLKDILGDELVDKYLAVSEVSSRSSFLSRQNLLGCVFFITLQTLARLMKADTEAATLTRLVENY
jgi:glutamine synthetase